MSAPKRPTLEQRLLSAPYTRADVYAWKALAAGTANEAQQQRAVAWLIAAAGTYDVAWFPGADDAARATDFANGKRFVGQQVVKLINMPNNIVSQIKETT